jgi:hypothetical protein
MNGDLTVSELFKAYYDCRKAKRNTWNALLFEENLERNLMELYYELIENRYVPQRSICFVVTKPKAREVWAANFRDRIVHHVIYNRYSQLFYNSFIYDTYACIPEKGTLKAAKRVQHFMKSASLNSTIPAFYMKADVANFFVSINKDILGSLLEKKIIDTWWLDLTKIVLYNDHKKNVLIKSSKWLLQKVPQHKSLLRTNHDLGLPIGNLSSQFFANVYLNELDQYAKHVLKIKYYARYVDDIVAIDSDAHKLHTDYVKMNTFIFEKLGIQFHPNKKEINKIENGVNFVGFIIKPYCCYVRRSTIQNCYQKIKNKTDLAELYPTVNSYFGMLRHTNSYKERLKLAKKLGIVGAWFNGKLTKMVIKNRKNYVHTINKH